MCVFLLSDCENRAQAEYQPLWMRWHQYDLYRSLGRRNDLQKHLQNQIDVQIFRSQSHTPARMWDAREWCTYRPIHKTKSQRSRREAISILWYLRAYIVLVGKWSSRRDRCWVSSSVLWNNIQVKVLVVKRPRPPQPDCLTRISAVESRILLHEGVCVF